MYGNDYFADKASLSLMVYFTTPQEVAQYLRVDRHTIYRWLREGRMKGIKFAGQYRISESQLREFLGQNEATEETNDG